MQLNPAKTKGGSVGFVYINAKLKIKLCFCFFFVVVVVVLFFVFVFVLFCFVLFFCKTGFLCVDLTVLELTL